MPTFRYKIKEVNRRHPIAIVGPADFARGDGQEIDAELVLRDSRFSLYCVDRENDEALFVESDDPDALESAPFYYQAQVEHAVSVVAMPLERFHRLASSIPDPAERLILVHSVSRCGSTLVSKVLGAAPGVHSLSEPDDLSQAVGLWNADRHEDVWMRNYIESAIRWRCRPLIESPANRVAIKTRAEVLVLAQFLGALFPRSKHLFLYRDGLSWMGSLFRTWNPERDPYDPDLNRKMMESWGDTLPIVRQAFQDGLVMNQVEVRMMAWISSMEAYFVLRRLCVPLCAARYEDIVRNPMAVIEEMFAFCEIESLDRSSIAEVLGEDSQAGTVYDREERSKYSRKLTPELIEDVRRLVGSRPLIGSTDAVLPGTIGLTL